MEPIATDLDVSRWLSLQVPRRNSGSSSAVLAWKQNKVKFWFLNQSGEFVMDGGKK